jgi:hypothetical protein
MEFDPVILSRFQFAWVIAWHILLPAFSGSGASLAENSGAATLGQRVCTTWGSGQIAL